MSESPKKTTLAEEPPVFFMEKDIPIEEDKEDEIVEAVQEIERK